MKRKYTKPSMSIDIFKANEYIAACWNIKCNVPYGYGFIDANGDGKYNKGENKIAEGAGCGTTHTASGIGSSGPSANAMWQRLNWLGGKKGTAYPVFHWNAKVHGSYSDHFSKVSDAQWEPNPNAS